MFKKFDYRKYHEEHLKVLNEKLQQAEKVDDNLRKRRIEHEEVIGAHLDFISELESDNRHKLPIGAIVTGTVENPIHYPIFEDDFRSDKELEKKVEDEQKSKENQIIKLKENMQIVNVNIENKTVELIQSLLQSLKVVSEPEEKQDLLKKLNELISWNCGIPKELIASAIIQVAELLFDKNKKVRVASLEVIDSFVETWREIKDE